MKIAPREQFILSVIGSVLLVVIMIALLIYPSYTRIGALDTEIADAQTGLSTTKSLLAQRQAIKDQAAQTDAKWLALANEVPDSPDLPALIIELQDSAFESGVQLVAATPTKPVNKGTYVGVPLQITILGTWADTVDYLQRIAKLSRGLRISQFVASVTDNVVEADRENDELPDYFEATTLNLEAYMIPASTGTTATTVVPAPAGQ